METVVALGKVLLSFVAGIGLEKVRKFLLDNVSERNTFYSALSTNISQIQNKLDLLTSEPYKTSLIFLKLGLLSGDESNIDVSFKESIRAFNLAVSIKEKYQSMMISIICTVLLLVNSKKKCHILLNEFISDKIIQELFKCIARKKYDEERENLVQIGWFFFLNLPLRIPYAIITCIPVTVTYVPHIQVSWDEQCYFSEDLVCIKGFSSRAYHIDQQLVVSDMKNELDDLKYIIMFLNMTGNLLNMDKIRINEDFFWVARSKHRGFKERSHNLEDQKYKTRNLKLMI